MTKAFQELLADIRLLRSGRCKMEYAFGMLIYLQSHQLLDASLHNV